MHRYIRGIMTAHSREKYASFTPPTDIAESNYTYEGKNLTIISPLPVATAAPMSLST